MKGLLACLLTGLLLCHGAFAEIYQWTDENGKVHYTDKKPEKKSQQVKLKPSQVLDSSAERRHQANLKKQRNSQSQRKRKRAEQVQAQNEEEYAEKLKDYCADLEREKMTTLRATGMYRWDRVKKKRVYMTVEEQDEYLRKVNEALSESCS